MNQKDKDLLKIAALIVAVFLVLALGKRIFAGLDKLLVSLGLKKSDEEIKLETDVKDQATKDSPFSPAYWVNMQRKSKIYLLYKSNLTNLAQQIYSSVGTVFDTPEVATAAFKQCRYKTQVSQLADEFQRVYKKDLLAWLYDKFDTDSQKAELSNILNYVNSLPDGSAK